MKYLYIFLLIIIQSSIIKSINIDNRKLDFEEQFENDLKSRMCQAYLAYYDNLITVKEKLHPTTYQCLNNNNSDNSIIFTTDKIFNITYTGYDIFGYVSYNRKLKEVNVVFRGTKIYNIYNWIENLSFLKISPYINKSTCKYCDLISVHRGFYSAYNNLKYSIIRSLLNVEIECPTCNTINFIGHSMGGALASMALFDLNLFNNLTYYNNISLYTYGAPRVGNNVYADIFNHFTSVNKEKNIQFYRVVNNQDLVPHVPPYKIGYHHHKIEIWIHKIKDENSIEKEIIKICDGLLSKGSIGEDQTCSNSLRWKNSISDHLSYFNIKNITKLIN